MKGNTLQNRIAILTNITKWIKQLCNSNSHSYGLLYLSEKVYATYLTNHNKVIKNNLKINSSEATLSDYYHYKWGLIGVLSNYESPMSLHPAGRQLMLSALSINARKCVHAQKPSHLRHSRRNQARREEKERERQKRQRPGGCWKERQPNKTKTHRSN